MVVHRSVIIQVAQIKVKGPDLLRILVNSLNALIVKLQALGFLLLNVDTLL